MIKLDLSDIFACEKDLSYIGKLGKVKNLKVVDLDLSYGLNYSQKLIFLAKTSSIKWLNKLIQGL